MKPIKYKYMFQKLSDQEILACEEMLLTEIENEMQKWYSYTYSTIFGEEIYFCIQ